ncbi:MAG: hypothetical protein KDK71_09675, partial [Chlamydiia bacterium]|nr:hypothetical protein [Chlamydiia bacterium]
MDTRQLSRAVRLLQTDLVENKILDAVTTLNAKCNEFAANPADANKQTEFSSAVAQFRDRIKAAQTNDLAISTRRALDSAGLLSLTAPVIATRVNAVLNEAPFVQATAAAQLKKIQSNVQNKWNATEQVLKSLDSLNIGDPGEQDDFEAGFLMPSSFTEDNLRVLQHQLKNWIQLIDALEELAYGKVNDKIPVTALGQGSFEVFVGLGAPIALGMLVLTRGVTRALQVSIDAKNEAERLREVGYSEDVIEKMEADQPNLLDRIKEETINEAIKLVAKLAGISNKESKGNFEIAAKLRVGFDFALKSANRGVDVEVSSPTRAPETAEAEKSVDELYQQIEALRREVLKRTEALPDRSKPIMELPPPDASS